LDLLEKGSVHEAVTHGVLFLFFTGDEFLARPIHRCGFELNDVTHGNTDSSARFAVFTFKDFLFNLKCGDRIVSFIFLDGKP